MTESSFVPPALETMNHLLPAFGFTALLASNDRSAVYAATQKSLDRSVAIKVLSPFVSANPEFRSTFEVTARTMAKLNHPNLIGVFDSGFVGGMIYFVMEFIPGKSLQRSAQGQCVEVGQALRLVDGISSGLAYAHDHGVIHGALDPSVILLNQKAEPKIGNFGLSKPSGNQRNPCRAPELDTSAKTDHRADVYAVGAILYELVTGHPHKPGAAAPSSLAKCPATIDAICGRATDPDPSKRHPGMRALLKEVSKCLAQIQGGGGGALARAAKPAGAGSPAKLLPASDVPPPTGPQAPVSHAVGVNWHFIRNLVIIAGLSYAIYLTWGFYQEKKVRTAREDREMAARNAAEKARAIEEAKQRELERRQNASNKVAPVTPVNPEPVAPRAESTEQSLARLKSALAAGRRDQMPQGTVQQGESSYLLVREPLSWPEAAEFAEAHGAHLAVPAVGADLTWLANQVTQKLDVWIGAARSGQNAWTLADGKSWKPSKDPSGLGTYVGIDKAGFLRAASAKVRLPFVIQWHKDGKNPGTLENLLAATKASLASGNPVFPPGTRALEGRNFLYVARPLDWNDAVGLAAAGGGHLAVPSTAAEAAILGVLTDDVEAPDGLWIGASLKDSQWAWITGEPWKFAKWGTNVASDVRGASAVIRPGKHWDALKPGSRASGLIIEWSADSKSSPKAGAAQPGGGRATADSPSAESEIESLTQKAKSLLIAADRKRSEQLSANAKKLAVDLDAHLRGLPKSGQDTWRPEVDRIKASITGVRVPEMIPLASGIKINTTMDGIVRYGAKKQQQIDDEFNATAAKLHAAFLLKLRESLAQARQAGQPLLVKSCESAISGSERVNDWLASMGVDPKPANPVPGATPKTEPDSRTDAGVGKDGEGKKGGNSKGDGLIE